MPAPSVAQLGYLGFEVSDLEAWERFATQVLGLGVARRDPSGFTLRMDAHAQRFFISEGPADDLAVVGWQVPGDAELDTLVDRLRSAAVDVTEGTPEECEHRDVARLVKLHDPAGNPLEIFHGPKLADAPFASEVLASSFVADELGLGHLVVTANSQAESKKFYMDLLGFGLSDHIRTEFWGFKVDLAFFHANPRHHSLAFGDQAPGGKRIHHFLIEVASMDDVGMAYDRAIKNRCQIMNMLGRHPNDRMFSFYALTPSGFQFEFGWGGREVTPGAHEPVVYDRISEWGHQPPIIFKPRKKKPAQTPEGTRDG